jgi:hypothetical protein
LALADDLGGLRDRRGRRPGSLKKLFRKVNPHAWRAVQRGIHRGLDRLDDMAAAAPARAHAAGRLPVDCDHDVPTVSESFNSNAGGEKLTAVMTLGRESVLALGLQSGDFTINLRFADGGPCHRFDAPTCPTAAGVIDATDSSRLMIALSIARRGELIVSKHVTFTGHTRMHAQVDEDAKLDFIDVDHSQTANIHLGGTRQSFGPVSLHYTGLHQTRVDMPAGTYDASRSAVDIAFTERGITVGKSQLGDVATDLAGDLGKQFATLVDREITNFKKLETGWNRPNTCVDVHFNPAPMTLELDRHAHGSFTAQAIARQDGAASPGHWTRTGSRNARFTPERADGAAPQFSYDVTNAGTNVLVTATLHAATRAGVAEASWSQKTEDAPRYLGHVEGTLSYESTGHCHWTDQFSYSADLHDVYSPHGPFDLQHGGGLTTSYDDSGSGKRVVDPCDDEPGCTVSFQAADPDAWPDLFQEGSADFFQYGDDLSVEIVEVRTASWSYSAPSCGGEAGIQPGFTLGAGRLPVSALGAQTITVPISGCDEDSEAVCSGTLTLHRVD